MGNDLALVAVGVAGMNPPSRTVITGLAPSVTWVLADNSVIQATPAELTEALVLAGQAQAAIWVL